MAVVDSSTPRGTAAARTPRTPVPKVTVRWFARIFGTRTVFDQLGVVARGTAITGLVHDGPLPLLGSRLTAFALTHGPKLPLRILAVLLTRAAGASVARFFLRQLRARRART